MESYRTLGGGSVDGYFGKNPDWSKIKVKTGRTIWSSYDDNTLQAWLVEDTNSGGVLLAGGNYANPIQIAGNGLPRISGYFVDGFVFENPNQVGIDASGNSWQYVGTSPLPYTVTAGTVPSEPEYEKVFESNASNVTTSSGGSVQDYINENLTPFESVADMRAYDYSSIDSGSRIEWQGYYSQSDGGSNWGVLKKGDSTTLTDDGGSIFIIVNDIINGVWIESFDQLSGISVEKFGYETDLSDQINSILQIGRVAKVSDKEYNSNTIFVTSPSSVISGTSRKRSVINFSGDGIIFNAEQCDINDLHLKGAKDTVTVDPDSGTLGNVGITHQDNPNSGRSEMENLVISGFNTGYSEKTATDVWTGAYRKLTSFEVFDCDLGLSFVGGSTDFRASIGDIRNCPEGAVYVNCPLDTQYSNIRLSNVLVESCGATGVLTGTSKNSGFYIGKNSSLSISGGYFENTSICCGKGGSFSLSDSYKAFPVRVYGLGFIGINGGYEVLKLNIESDISSWPSILNCTATYNTSITDKNGQSTLIESSGSGSAQLTSQYDSDILKKISITDTDQAFLLVRCRVNADNIPTSNYFGPSLRAGFVATDGSGWTNNITLDMDTELIKSVDSDWQYINYIIPIRFGATGLTVGEYLRQVRLQLVITDTTYSTVSDGAFSINAKDFEAYLYKPR